MRVRSGEFARIAKEVDRLDEDEGEALEPEHPAEYERDDSTAEIDYLAQFPQVASARELGLMERGWRKVIRRQDRPRVATAKRIREITTRYSSHQECAT
jgi:hypothetical protein